MSWKLDGEHRPNHTSYALYCHVVWATKKREPLIDREVAGFLDQFLAAKCEELEVRLLARGILCDHIHLLLSLRPAHYLPEVVNYLKGAASHEANHHCEFDNPLYWTRGYRIATVSESSLHSAKAYVRDQHKRHPDKVPQ